MIKGGVYSRVTEALDIRRSIRYEELQDYQHHGKCNSHLEIWRQSLCNGLRYMPAQSKTRSEKKNHKELHNIRTRKRMIREQRRTGKK